MNSIENSLMALTILKMSFNALIIGGVGLISCGVLGWFLFQKLEKVSTYKYIFKAGVFLLIASLGTLVNSSDKINLLVTIFTITFLCFSIKELVRAYLFSATEIFPTNASKMK